MQASIIIRSKRGKDASLKAGTSMKTRFFREETLARERERGGGRDSKCPRSSSRSAFKPL